MTSFKDFNLSDALMRSLAEMNYATPTPIQAQTIPLAMAGRDILGSAQTGTGKTAAFGIPLVERLLRTPRGSALVLTPTRELGKQVMEVLQQLLGKNSPITTAFLIGGDPMGPQLAQLRRRPRLIVGTPGRINDHLERGNLMLHDTGFLVLDETDRMLDLGFGIQIDKILKFLTGPRQTLMFSATLPEAIVRLSAKYLNNPERIAVGQSHVPAENISQEIIRVDDDGKYQELLRQLDARTGSIVIFVATKHGTEKLAKRLNRDHHKAEPLHGDLRQNRRERVVQGFRDSKYRVLVATDIAARGLDIPHIEHVINYDLPQCPEDYIHRIGRTARAGADGDAVSLLAPRDMDKWRAIERLLNPGQKPALSEGENGGKSQSRNRNRNRSRNRKPGRNRNRNRRGGHSKESGDRPAGRSLVSAA